VVTYIVTIIAIWVISALVAIAVAPRGRQAEFFALTLLILGPLGVGFAAVAVPREPEIPGRARVVCPRCAAAQYIGTGVDEFDCWRCDQRGVVDRSRLGGPIVQVASKPKVEAASKPRVEASSKPKVAPKVTPVGKTTTIRCFKCQHTQQVPASASTFQCEKCNATLKRAAKS
jgi:ribosomal protein S27E